MNYYAITCHISNPYFDVDNFFVKPVKYNYFLGSKGVSVVFILEHSEPLPTHKIELTIRDIKDLEMTSCTQLRMVSKEDETKCIISFEELCKQKSILKT